MCKGSRVCQKKRLLVENEGDKQARHKKADEYNKSKLSKVTVVESSQREANHTSKS